MQALCLLGEAVPHRDEPGAREPPVLRGACDDRAERLHLLGHLAHAGGEVGTGCDDGRVHVSELLFLQEHTQVGLGGVPAADQRGRLGIPARDLRLGQAAGRVPAAFRARHVEVEQRRLDSVPLTDGCLGARRECVGAEAVRHLEDRGAVLPQDGLVHGALAFQRLDQLARRGVALGRDLAESLDDRVDADARCVAVLVLERELEQSRTRQRLHAEAAPEPRHGLVACSASELLPLRALHREVGDALRRGERGVRLDGAGELRGRGVRFERGEWRRDLDETGAPVDRMRHGHRGGSARRAEHEPRADREGAPPAAFHPRRDRLRSVAHGVSSRRNLPRAGSALRRGRLSDSQAADGGTPPRFPTSCANWNRPGTHRRTRPQRSDEVERPCGDRLGGELHLWPADADRAWGT